MVQNKMSEEQDRLEELLVQLEAAAPLDAREESSYMEADEM